VTFWSKRGKPHAVGYIAHMDTTELGRMLISLGGGRHKAEDAIDHRVGFVFQSQAWERACSRAIRSRTVYAKRDQSDISDFEKQFHAPSSCSATAPSPRPRITPTSGLSCFRSLIAVDGFFNFLINRRLSHSGSFQSFPR